MRWALQHKVSIWMSSYSFCVKCLWACERTKYICFEIKTIILKDHLRLLFTLTRRFYVVSSLSIMLLFGFFSRLNVNLYSWLNIYSTFTKRLFIYWAQTPSRGSTRLNHSISFSVEFHRKNVLHCYYAKPNQNVNIMSNINKYQLNFSFESMPMYCQLCY